MLTFTAAQLAAIAYAATGLSAVLFLLLLALVGMRGHVPPLSYRQRAERADAHGNELLRMARVMEAQSHAFHHLAPNHEAQLRRWARTCRQIARDHLDTIDALSLDALQQVDGGAVHLGDFAPAINRRRNPEGQPITPQAIWWRTSAWQGRKHG